MRIAGVFLQFDRFHQLFICNEKFMNSFSSLVPEPLAGAAALGAIESPVFRSDSSIGKKELESPGRRLVGFLAFRAKDPHEPLGQNADDG